MKTAVTIRDVAKTAGVHFTTVSLALRNDPRITPATAAKVRAAVEKLGYRPNPMVAALMTSMRAGRRKDRALTLAFCTHWEKGEGWRKMRTHQLFFEGVQTRGEAMGYRVEHFNLAEPGFTPARWDRIFHTRGIRGLILASFQSVVSDLPLDWSRLCAVRIDPNPRNPHLDTVCTNQSQVVRVAFRHANARGYKRIGLVVNRLWDERLGDALLSGYLTEQAAVPARRRVPAFWTHDWNREAFGRWFEQARPDALLSLGDTTVMGWLADLGVRIPEDVGFVTLDHNEKSGAVAGMRKNHTLLGASAVDMLLGKLNHNEPGVPEFPRLLLLAGRWVEGRSLRPLPADAEDPAAGIG